MKKVFRILASTLIILLGVTSPTQANQSSITVMSRNIYLGADVGIAMKLLPDFKAAAQFMWEQVERTDFNQRSSALAKEIATAEPDVVGIQEATKWMCKKGLLSSRVTVYDFTQMLLIELDQLGYSYEIASNDEKQAINPGFSIPPIPHLTMVTDTDVFPSVFGTDTVACGFEIADVLLVKSDLSMQVKAAGTTEYESAYAIIPTLMTVYRGFSWADISFQGTEIRFVTTHLESLWDEGEVPLAKIQADQLVQDLANSEIPVVVMGDFNSDPRDPRGTGQSNPGEQPETSEVCPEQIRAPTVDTAKSDCSAYWTMIEAGYSDSGPDSQDPRNTTWGANALLAGPDPKRQDAALQMGNQYGFTDRLDYVFLSSRLRTAESRIVGNTWPSGEQLWNCSSTEQKDLSQSAISKMDTSVTSGALEQTKCLPSDHAGLVVDVSFVASDTNSTTYPESHTPFPIGFWKGIGIVLILFLIWRIRRRVATSRALKAV
jgi:endonuclease/exonuclease/phosphatase family metal-dependent hydrolase